MRAATAAQEATAERPAAPAAPAVAAEGSVVREVGAAALAAAEDPAEE